MRTPRRTIARFARDWCGAQRHCSWNAVAQASTKNFASADVAQASHKQKFLDAAFEQRSKADDLAKTAAALCLAAAVSDTVQLVVRASRPASEDNERLKERRTLWMGLKTACIATNVGTALVVLWPQSNRWAKSSAGDAVAATIPPAKSS